ncbi:MAG: DUF3540 domain-containing protein [Sandaracinaceae bacterium]|nr:DUF3540 domain-containing protein [Sandaracinaceae bacterium]
MRAAEVVEDPPDAGPREGRVVALRGPRAVQVEVGAAVVDATVATTGDYRPVVGDRVVVLVGAEGAWVLGVVGAIRPVVAGRTSDGVAATVESDVLTVRGAHGEVLFTHDARTGRSVVSSREVLLRADELDLEGRAVRIRGQESLSIGVGEQSLTMDEGNTQLEATRFGAKLGDARFSIQQAFFAAGRVDSAVKAVRHTADVVESRVGRIVERMRDAFREVEGVQQIRGGRIRMVARDAYTVMANHVTLKAEDDMEIMAEKIELG